LESLLSGFETAELSHPGVSAEASSKSMPLRSMDLFNPIRLQCIFGKERPVLGRGVRVSQRVIAPHDISEEDHDDKGDDDSQHNDDQARKGQAPPSAAVRSSAGSVMCGNFGRDFRQHIKGLG
jgi:hypothetical protein